MSAGSSFLSVPDPAVIKYHSGMSFSRKKSCELCYFRKSGVLFRFFLRRHRAVHAAGCLLQDPIISSCRSSAAAVRGTQTEKGRDHTPGSIPYEPGPALELPSGYGTADRGTIQLHLKHTILYGQKDFEKHFGLMSFETFSESLVHFSQLVNHH